MSHEIKEQFWKALASSPFLMVRLNASTDHALPMTAQLDEELGPERGGAIWFFTETGNRLAGGGAAMAQFMSRGHDLFACLSGRIVAERDPALIDRFWSNPVASWYEGGRNDPKLLLLRMTIDDLEIWTADLGIAGRLRLMTGSKIEPREAGQHIHEAL